MLGRLFRRRRHDGAMTALYAAIVAQARQPGFYRDLGVPDNVDGRFDLLVLHAFLVMRRLSADESGRDGAAQALFDHMFRDMDGNLREMGAGDLGVGRRVKKMARAFYGRATAYEAALAGDGDELAAALRRNVWRDAPAQDGAVAALAAYVRREASALTAQDAGDLAAGRLTFGPVPGLADREGWREAV